MTKLFYKMLILVILMVSLDGAYSLDKSLDSSRKNKNPKILGAISKVDKMLTPQRVKLIGNILKHALESYHYKKIDFNDSLSVKAFGQYIKKIDYGKQFLLKKDIQSLKKYERNMDDHALKGEVDIINDSMSIIKKRIRGIEEIRKKMFEGKFKFDLEKKELIEFDPDKRSLMTSKNELEDYWRKNFKHSVIVRYLSLQEEQEERLKPDKDKKKKNKKKNKKKKKKEKKEPVLNKKQMLKKAKKAIAKRYKKFFKRMLEETATDYLEKFFNSLTNTFDPHTVYMPPRRKEDFDIDISGKLEGIGAVLQEDESYIKVVKILPGGPAWRGRELEADDKITAVAQGSGEPVGLIDMKVDEAVRYIRGKKGTEVRLTVKKVDNTVKIISIIRDVVPIGESYAKSSFLVNKKLGVKIGYIMLPKFYRDFGGKGGRNCTEDIRKEILMLKKIGIDGIILDIRNNGGGALEDAKQISGLFIEKGPVVQVRDYNGDVEILSDEDKTIVYDGPLLILTNHFSASASEILAGAIQDYGRGVIVGGNFTHGKGTVQAVLDLNRSSFIRMSGAPLGALKVTMQKFYRITGASTQFKGVTPDIFLPDPYGYAKNREMDMDNALAWDTIKGQSFKKWKRHKFNIAKLNLLSAKRVKKDKRLQQINKSLDHLIKRRDETKISIKLADIIKQNKENKKLAEKMKNNELDENLKISHFEESLKVSFKNFKKKDRKKWKEDFNQRKEDWIETLQKDSILGESMNIMKDMLVQLKK